MLFLVTISFSSFWGSTFQKTLRFPSQSPAPLLRSTTKNHQEQDAEQDTEKRTRDGEPEGSVPPESFAVLLVFTLFSQAFEGRDFRKSEIFRPGAAAQRRGTVRFELVI
jgi:hypothetical protein